MVSYFNSFAGIWYPRLKKNFTYNCMQNQAKNHLSTVEYIQNKIEYFIFKQIFGNAQLRGAFAQY